MDHKFYQTLYTNENSTVQTLLANIQWDNDMAKESHSLALDLVKAIRRSRKKAVSLESFFQQYGLNTKEGRALMELAEALLRIPDSRTANALIRDKIAGTQWLKKAQSDDDWFIKMTGLGLSASSHTINSLFSKVGEPIIREALTKAMGVLGKQFVLAETIKKAESAGKNWRETGFRFSYDILGEGARTQKDALAYFENYKNALLYLTENYDEETDPERQPGISVKLSALHPRFELLNQESCVADLSDMIIELCDIAAQKGLTLTIDAEEAARIEPTWGVINAVIQSGRLTDWHGFGMAIQAYHKAAPELIDRLETHLKQQGAFMQVRLVKGAYWDTEIKHVQIEGHDDYPVYTRKANTDVSYLMCAQKLLSHQDVIYPMFGTHNAHTVAAIISMTKNDEDFEFQKLYGMGDSLYNFIAKDATQKISIYAPIGPYKDLLPYLVRRMLENGANSSFVHQISDKNIKPENIVIDPVQLVNSRQDHRHPDIALPIDIYKTRQNSRGLNFDRSDRVQALTKSFSTFDKKMRAYSLVSGKDKKGSASLAVINPTNKNEIGRVEYANDEIINDAFQSVKTGLAQWSNQPIAQRAAIIRKFADKLDEHRDSLIYLANQEGGRTLKDADDEVREAIDFCRYYANHGMKLFNEHGIQLPTPTGETNKFLMEERGVFTCISPWNFPIAIFTGQIVAALVAGNTVIAKPAEQTCITGYHVIKLLLESGLPKDAIAYLPGDGDVGAQIVAHQQVAGVAFTGSNNAARSINQTLANKDGAIAKLIAETGGKNALIADSSALTEQVVDDVIHSAFGSAGQRCSACRVLFIQDSVADID